MSEVRGGKSFKAKERTKKKLKPLMVSRPGFEPVHIGVGGECCHHYNTLSSISPPVIALTKQSHRQFDTDPVTCSTSKSPIEGQIKWLKKNIRFQGTLDWLYSGMKRHRNWWQISSTVNVSTIRVGHVSYYQCPQNIWILACNENQITCFLFWNTVNRKFPKCLLWGGIC